MDTSVADVSDVAGTAVAAGISEVALDGGVDVMDGEHDAIKMENSARQQKIVRFITVPLFSLHRIA